METSLSIFVNLVSGKLLQPPDFEQRWPTTDYFIQKIPVEWQVVETLVWVFTLCTDPDMLKLRFIYE